MKQYLSIFLVSTVAIYACSQSDKEKQSKETSSTTESEITPQALINSEQIKERGLEITSHMQQVLAGQLIKAIEDSGVTYALQYCNLNASRLTDSISNLHNVRIKRVSHKARNIRNQVNRNESDMIRNFQKHVEQGQLLEPIVSETDERFTYFAPIMLMAPLCLKCHGIPDKDIAPQDFIAINMLYPDAKATGFQMNDLRGMWRVDFDKSTLVQ